MSTNDIPRGIAIVIIMLDELQHTNEHPFCSDMTCGCHSDLILNDEYLFKPWWEGLLTTDESQLMWEGRTI